MAAVVPFYFAFNVVRVSNSSLGHMKVTNFGGTMFFKLYAFLFSIVQNIIPTLVLVILNTVSLVKFKRFISKKRRNASVKRSKINGSEERFTRLILALTFIGIINHFLEFVANTFYRLKVLQVVEFSLRFAEMISVMKIFSLFCKFLEHALDTMLYFVYDTNLRSLVFNLFKKEHSNDLSLN